MKKFNATAHREGNWWVIKVPELDQTTQAQTTADIEKMARDLIATMRNLDPSEVEVTVTMDDSSEKQSQREAREARSRLWIQTIVMLVAAVSFTGLYFEGLSSYSIPFAWVIGAALVSALVAIGICIDLFLRVMFQGRTVSRRRSIAVAISGGIAAVLWAAGFLLLR